jgi:hypothetical protein
MLAIRWWTLTRLTSNQFIAGRDGLCAVPILSL